LNTTFGNRLRNLRENMNLTQLEVSIKIKCSCKVLSNYELDKREPDFETLSKLCDFFNVTADYLLGRTANPKYYKQMELDKKTENLLYYFEQLPETYKNDVIRFSKLNLLDMRIKE